jgi:FGGY-family pentulose kinase
MSEKSVFLLTFDFGTESVRGALFNEHGEMLHTAVLEYQTIFPKPGWAEQVPAEWWTAFLHVVKNLLDKSDVGPGHIPALCVDSTSCTVVALDGSFKPLRNALLWMDVRAFKQAELIAESGSDSLRYNGFGSVSAEWMPSKALWLKENEREIYDRAIYICELQDYINYRLTGEYVGSMNNVTIRWYFNSQYGGWPEDFYDTIGIGDAIDKFPKTVLRMGEPVGKIHPKAAAETGLSKDTVIIQGGADAYTGMLGLGTVKPGRLALITGSSHVMLGLSKKEFYKKGVFGVFPDGVIQGLYSFEGAQISTGSVLKWFKEQFIGKEYEQKAKKQGISLYDHMNELARQIRIGSDGLIILDFWQGNRNPLTDSQARGAIWGLSLNHTPVHVYRAIMEGISYGTEHIIRHFREAGFEPEEIYACGGATNSDLWIQIHSDVLGLPFYLTEEQNAPLLGDAVLASWGAGIYPSIEDAASNMVRVRNKIEPDMDRHRAYRYYVDKYIETYPRLRDLMHDMVRHETEP